MKQLILVRHSEAEDHHTNGDYERNLTSYGLQKIEQLANTVIEKGFYPDLVVCSSATRAYHTAKLLSQLINYDLKNIESYKSLYNPDIEELIDALTNLPKDKNNIILVNHNPAISHLVELLDSNPTYLFLQPCAAVCLLFDVEDWAEINPNTGTVVWKKIQFN